MRILVIICLAWATSGCLTTVTAKAPDSFAELRESSTDRVAMKAVSAKGVVYRVRTEKHEPVATIAFWQEALTNKLASEGYLITKSEPTKVAGHDGVVLQAIAPLADQDYGFIVGVAPVNNRIIIVESAGPRKALEEASTEVLQAFSSIELRD